MTTNANKGLGCAHSFPGVAAGRCCCREGEQEGIPGDPRTRLGLHTQATYPHSCTDYMSVGIRYVDGCHPTLPNVRVPTHILRKTFGQP